MCLRSCPPTRSSFLADAQRNRHPAWSEDSQGLRSYSRPQVPRQRQSGHCSSPAAPPPPPWLVLSCRGQFSSYFFSQLKNLHVRFTSIFSMVPLDVVIAHEHFEACVCLA